MLKVFGALAVFAGVVAMPVGAALAQDDGREISRCVIEVGEYSYLDGPCTFMPMDADGSFSIGTADDESELGYFAYIYMTDDPEMADGFWNGDEMNSHADTPLGALYRDNDQACWINDTPVRVCAYE